MGCNCKAKRDFSVFKKYSEEPRNGADYTPEVGMTNWFEKVVYAIMRLIGTVVLFSVFLVVAVPLLIYVGVCMALGMPAKVVLKNPYKWLNRKNKDTDGEQ